MTTNSLYDKYCMMVREEVRLQDSIAFSHLQCDAYLAYLAADEASASKMITDEVLRKAFDSLESFTTSQLLVETEKRDQETQ